MQQKEVQQVEVTVPTKVLVPIIKPSPQSIKIGKEVAEGIRGGDDTDQIGKGLAERIKANRIKRTKRVGK